MADQAQSGGKVGALLTLGIFFLPIIFVWFLLRAGYSGSARAIGFGWLVLSFLIFGFISSQEPTVTADRQPVAHTEQPAEQRIAYVSAVETEERNAPNGAIVNRIYRGQRLQVYEVDGDWARVTAQGFDPRWVRLSELSDSPPADLPQPDFENDARLAAIPRVGDYGHTEADVRALRMAALELLNSGQCSRIDDANKSVNVSGVYFVNCGEPRNRFFRMQDDRPRFCGHSADRC